MNSHLRTRGARLLDLLFPTPCKMPLMQTHRTHNPYRQVYELTPQITPLMAYLPFIYIESLTPNGPGPVAERCLLCEKGPGTAWLHHLAQRTLAWKLVTDRVKLTFGHADRLQQLRTSEDSSGSRPRNYSILVGDPQVSPQ